jgi:hypothetical protein
MSYWQLARQYRRAWTAWVAREQKHGRPTDRMTLAKAKPSRDPNFPATVTDGMNPDGTLRVLIFNSREQADAAGFGWVGR